MTDAHITAAGWSHVHLHECLEQLIPMMKTYIELLMLTPYVIARNM